MSTSVDSFHSGQFQLLEALPGISQAYEGTSWIIPRLNEEREISHFNQLKQAIRRVVAEASYEEKTELVRRFRIVASDALSSLNQRDASDSPSKIFLEFQELQKAYEERFGWPFLVFIKGPRHRNLSLLQCLSALEARIKNPATIELHESILQLHRIAEYQLSIYLGITPVYGYRIWDDCDALSRHSEEKDNLTVTFLSEAHKAVSLTLKKMFLDAGFDEVHIDAIGNVVGRYYGLKGQQSKYLLTGSHYDTVRAGGAFDGRVGIFVPLEFVRKLLSQNQRLPFGIELVAFSEEEGVRFPATFLGSSALVGDFRPEWLNLEDAKGIRLQSVLSQEGLATCIEDIHSLRRDPGQYIGFAEVHIEQGPVLYKNGLPLGVVTAINGSRRYKLRLFGQASHAGTTPMNDRRDVACAAAEIVLFVENAARKGVNTVATVGILQVPNGSINTVPGQCELSLDIRAPKDEDRDALSDAIFCEIDVICKRREIGFESKEVLSVSAAPCDAQLRNIWAEAVREIGLDTFELPSGAGHDAMKLAHLLPQAMLFVRGENNGISHNPLESTDSDDLQCAFEVFERFCLRLSNG